MKYELFKLTVVSIISHLLKDDKNTFRKLKYNENYLSKKERKHYENNTKPPQTNIKVVLLS